MRDLAQDRQLALGAGPRQVDIAEPGGAIGGHTFAEGLHRCQQVDVGTDRAHQRGGIAPLCGTGRVKALIELAALVRGPDRIPDVGVARGEAEHARPRATDQHRQPRPLQRLRLERGIDDLVMLAFVRRALLELQAIPDLERLGKAVDALPGGGKRPSVRLVFALGPPRADAEIDATARDVVNRDRLLEQKGWIAVGVRLMDTITCRLR